MSKLIILLISMFMVFTSCDNSIARNGRTILISVVSDYTDGTIAYGNDIPDLGNPPNDQAAIAGQIHELTNGNVELYLYRVENGERYTAEKVDDISTLFEYSTTVERTINNNKKVTRLKANLDNWDKTVPFSFQTIAATIQSLNAEENDLIIFHYSGHGLEDGTLLLGGDDYDQWGDVNLVNMMTNYNKKAKKVVLLDSCFSGAHIKDGILASSKDFKVAGKAENYVGDSFFKAIAGSWDAISGKDTYGTPNTYIMAAASDGQEAFDSFSGERNQELFGAFSFYLIRALGFDNAELKPQAIDSRISFYSLYKSIWDSFPSRNKKEQTPMATLSPFDLVLF